MSQDNPLPQYVTIDQTDAALRTLGIEPNGSGLISVEIGVWKVTVTRNVRDAGRLLATNVRVEVPIDRTRHSGSDERGE